MSINKDEAIKQFIKENFNFLTSMDFNRDTYKQFSRKYFYERYNNKFGTPTPKDICSALIFNIAQKGIRTLDIIDKINTLPLFNMLSESVKEDLKDSLRSHNQEYKSQLLIKYLRFTHGMAVQF